MVNRVLIVDNDPAFASMLKEGLQGLNDLRATVVETGAEVLTSVVEQGVDLVIVDVNMSDMAPAKLINAIREAKSSMKIMVTCFVGQPIPEEVQVLGIQGVLSKPFFVGDLPRLVGDALGVQLVVEEPPPVEEPAVEPAPEEPAEPEPAVEPEAAPEPGPKVDVAAIPEEIVHNLRKHERDIVAHLNDLNVEVNAEAILLTAGGELVAYTGVNLSRERAKKMAALVAQTAETAARAAAFLGEPSGRFEQSSHEGDSYRLYSYSLSQGIILSLALSSKLPLGILRHQTRQTSRELIRYIEL